MNKHKPSKSTQKKIRAHKAATQFVEAVATRGSREWYGYYCGYMAATHAVERKARKARNDASALDLKLGRVTSKIKAKPPTAAMILCGD